MASEDLKHEARERRRLSSNNAGGARAVDDAEDRLDAPGKKKKASAWKKFKVAFKATT